MSSVRMCDKCGKVFSENSENWSTMSGSQMYTDPVTGKRGRRDVEMDVCGTCNTIGLSEEPLQAQLTTTPEE